MEFVDYQLTRIPEWQSPARHYWPDRGRTRCEVFKDELEARGLSAHALAIALRLRRRGSGQRAVTLLSVIYMSKTHKGDSGKSLLSLDLLAGLLFFSEVLPR